MDKALNLADAKHPMNCPIWQSGVSSERKKQSVSSNHRTLRVHCRWWRTYSWRRRWNLFFVSAQTSWGRRGRRSIRTSSRVFSAITLCIPIPTPSITAKRIAHPIAEFLAALNPPRIANEPPVRNPAPTGTPLALSPSFTLLLSLAPCWQRTHTSIPRIFLLPKALYSAVKCRE